MKSYKIDRKYQKCVKLDIAIFISNQQLGVTLASVPFFAASKRATSPLSKSATSGKPSLTRSSGVFPS